jgi:hypothetical protein
MHRCCWLQVTKVDNSLIGCANATANACPFVAYRTAPGWTLDRCVDTTSCPAYSAGGNQFYTVPAMAAGSSVPSACLTLASNQACPEVDGLQFPIEVMYTEPTSPVCGGAVACTTTRAVQCMGVNSTCPSGFNLRLFKNPNNNATATPQLVECRQTRAACDLTAAGMGPSFVNSGLYNIEVKTGDALDGCIISTSNVCPAGYPFPTPTTGRPTLCTALAPPPPPPVVCTSSQVPLYNINGTVEACQSATTACSSPYPISLRKDASGNLAGCLATNSTCPTGFNFPVYSAGGATNNVPVLSNCWANGVVTSCANIVIAQGAGTLTFPKAIMSNATGTERSVGCMASAVASCPAAYPFAWLDTTNPATMANPSLSKCSPAGEVTACQAPGTTIGTTFSKPAYTKNTLSACIKGSWSGANPTCPTAFPVVALNRLDPNSAPVAATADAEVLGCWSADSTCANTPQPFTLQGANQVAYCVPQIIGLQGCSAFPATGYGTGAGIFSPDGAVLIGCVANGVACPATFPIYFRNTANGADQRCQASLASTCGAASANFPVPISSSTGAVVGCLASNTNCPAGQIPLASTASGPASACSAVTTSCADANFPFPLYDQTAGSAARLARCMPAQAAANCNDANTFADYVVEVFGNAAGTGNVVGCMKQNAQTVCPANAPVAYMGQVTAAAISFQINECRPAPATCGTNIALKSSDGINTLGCLATGATTCPGAWATAAGPATVSPYPFPFFLVSTAKVDECRQVPNPAPTVANGCAAFLGVGTTYTATIAQLGAGNSAVLAGCAKSPAASCPAGYLATYTAQDITGCSTAASCTAPAVEVRDATGTLIGCGDTNTCAALFPAASGGSITLKNANGAAVTGCMSPAATACPTIYFSIYGSAATAANTVPPLTECWSSGAAANCAAPLASTVVVYDNFGKNAAVGVAPRSI